MKKTSLLILAILLASFSPGLFAAEEVVIAAKNCAITPPDGWERVENLPRPEVVVLFGRSDKRAMLSILVDEKNKVEGPLDERFVREFEIGAEKSGGGKRISGGIIEIAGIKSYERSASMMINGRQTSTLMQTIPADGKFYSLQAMQMDGESADNAVIRKALASFRFLKPPRVPPSGTGHLLASALPGIVMVVVIIVVIGINVSQRKPKGPPKIPPP